MDLPIDHVSYLGIILVLVLTGSGLPLPEELPIVAAGVASSQGTLHPPLALACCVIGALAGDSVVFFIGYHFGRSLVTRHPRFAQLLHADREAKIERMIHRHGWKVFLLARFMVGVRAPMYLTAGILRMPFRRFLLIDAFCATIVVGFFFGLAYLYGDHVTALVRVIQRSELGLTAVAGAGLLVCGVYLLWKRRWSGRRGAESALEGGESIAVGVGTGPDMSPDA